MKLDEKIGQRLEYLVSTGNSLTQSLGDYQNYDNQLAQQLSQWAISCLSLLERVFDPSSKYYVEFMDYYNMGLANPHPLHMALGVLKAAEDDYKYGFLFDIRNIIAAEMFDDFLDQAEHLLAASYQGPAAVIAGCVLEDGLRKLCQRYSISLPDKPKLDIMNVALAKSGAYNPLTQKKILYLAGIRNKAAHGQWKDLTDADVSDLLNGVRSFMAQHFT